MASKFLTKAAEEEGVRIQVIHLNEFQDECVHISLHLTLFTMIRHCPRVKFDGSAAA